MFAMCVHELNLIWSFFLDQNHFESPKVMTLTFDLENEKRPYSIKLWCIIYLNTKFDGYILKTVDVANLYITLLQRRKKLQWPLVTLTFEIWSPKKKSVQSRVCSSYKNTRIQERLLDFKVARASCHVTGCAIIHIPF